ncbi:hypothetical protein CLOM_g18043 [Closterium sp. NIES-68]|nr:hypothetical protein CLOM_g18043 [Closterium sp. NIES-68]
MKAMDKEVMINRKKSILEKQKGKRLPEAAARFFVAEVIKKDGKLSFKHFQPIKLLGAGDTGSVHLVELRDTTRLFAMKAMDKEVMINRNKRASACQRLLRASLWPRCCWRWSTCTAKAWCTVT